MRVVAACLRDGDRVLLAQRPLHKQHGGLWELPGGKVEAGESDQAALARELLEELGIHVKVGAHLATAERPEIGMTLLLYACEVLEGTPTALEAAALGWFTSKEARALPVPPADRPLLEAIGGQSG